MQKQLTEYAPENDASIKVDMGALGLTAGTYNLVTNIATDGVVEFVGFDTNTKPEDVQKNVLKLGQPPAHGLSNLRELLKLTNLFAPTENIGAFSFIDNHEGGCEVYTAYDGGGVDTRYATAICG